MKKTGVVYFTLFAILISLLAAACASGGKKTGGTAQTSAQSQRSTAALSQPNIPMINIEKYADIVWLEILKEFGVDWRRGINFPNQNPRSFWADIQGNLTNIDTPLEGALSAYYRYAERHNAAADALLPKDNPRLADLQLGSHVYKDMIVYRFFNKTDAVTRHEQTLNSIIGRGNVNRAEIEAFFRNGIRGLVNEVLNDEFNKIQFSLLTDTDGCTAYMERRGKQYTITCNGFWGNPKVSEKRVFSGSSLDELIQNMQASGVFRATYNFLFTEIINGRTYNKGDTIDTFTYIRANAAQLPAVATPTATRNELVNLVTTFFLTPNKNTYNDLLEEYIYLYDGSKNEKDVANSFYDAVNYLRSNLITKQVIMMKMYMSY